MVASVLLLIFLVIGIINYRQKQKANAEVLRQKRLLEEKNKEVADSINYASRIQKSIMPDEKTIAELMPDGFVLYLPKDIVSGDFYWINNYHDVNGKVHHLMAVADCTGHGVPGAFMSLIGATILNQTLNNPEISDPAQALDYLNVQLPKNIKSSSASGTIKDGMEISMCEYDAENLKMQFAGANNNLYLVRNGELQLIRGDKRPIGQGYENLGNKFSNHQIQLQKGDTLYMSSDGFPDQFGGPKGKKFKYKQMEEIFLEIHQLPVSQQREILKKHFIDWKGELDQVDDVCIIGFKI
jgi:serine phosphatase RsbU (regulator of sigma subunit)